MFFSFSALVFISGNTVSLRATPDGCTHNLDCELNGVCNNGACVCSPGWTGFSCGELDLLPATRGAGYRREGYSSWGGSAVQSEEDSNTWVMYAAEMDLHCGLSTWSTNSRIIRAESTTGPGGSYSFKEVVKDRFAHEPTVIGPTAGKGDYLLYHVGAGRGQWAQNKNPPCKSCSSPGNGSTPKEVCKGYPHDDAAFVAQTWLWKSHTARGPWSEVGVVQTPDGPHDGYSDSNPAPIVFANGTVMMLWRSAGCRWLQAVEKFADARYFLVTSPTVKACSDHCPALASPLPAACAANTHSCWQSRLHLATATHWSNVSSYSFHRQTLFPCGGLTPNVAERGAEDPYLYQDRTTAAFHAILHRNGCKDGTGCEPTVSGQHAFSPDGHKWYLGAGDAYTANVNYTDGSWEKLRQRERPHLILDPATGKPTHLITGAGVGEGTDYTYTHIQPIR